MSNFNTSPSTSRSAPFAVILLAGGLGTRLQSVAPDRPKVMVHVAGRPFLDYVLAYLADQGTERVFLSVGYLSEQILDFAGDGERWGLKLSYIQDRPPLGTGGALRQASEALDDLPFIAMNGDTLFQINLGALWKAHHAMQTRATLALRRVKSDEAEQRGCVNLAKDGRILSFEEKPIFPANGPLGEMTVLTNGGIYVLEKQALAAIKPGEAASIERHVFPQLAANWQLGGHVQDAYFADIGTPESLAAFERDVAAGVIPLPGTRKQR